MLNPFRSLLAVAFILALGMAWAAEPPTPANPPLREPTRPTARETDRVDRPAATTIRAGSVDHFMTSCLRKANQAEITLAKLAQQRASNAQVKAFAEQMIKDHGEFLTKLESSGPGVSSTTALKPEFTVPPARSNAAGGPSATLDQMAQIGNEIAERCLASKQRELEQKEGADFDKCFMGMQIGAHMKMVDELTVFKKYASPELGKTISEGLHTSEEHLSHAKKIAQHLDALTAEKTAARPYDDTRK